MKPVGPIYTVELFPPLSGELQLVLKQISPDQWNIPTACAPWDVKDVAAHLLGGNFGRLWNQNEPTKPGHAPDLNYQTLLAKINQDNDLWVRAARRISPEVITELLALTDVQLYDHFLKLVPNQPAPISVAWAGDIQSPNWFDIAREYTEKWLHQQHIREAVGSPLLLERAWYFPVLDTFVRGLPYIYRAIEAEAGTSIGVRIPGPAGHQWTLKKNQNAWQLFSGNDIQAKSVVTINPDLAWRTFTRSVSPEDAGRQVRIEGDQRLGRPVLDLVSIMG